MVAHMLLHEADEISDGHGAEHRRPDWRAARGELAARRFVLRVSGPASGFMAGVVLPFGHERAFSRRRKMMRSSGCTMTGSLGKLDG